ncbi:MAG: TrmH family RNA methyltransferase [Bacteroidia bacterium]
MALSAADIKSIRSLQQKKFRREQGLFVAEGVKTVSELLSSNLTVEHVYATEPLEVGNSSIIVETVKAKELERISSLTSANSVLAIAKIPVEKPINHSNSMVLVLDGIRDPGNLGTIIRTAKWFGVEDIICSEDCVDAYSPKVVQSSMGGLFHVNLNYTELHEVIPQLKSNGYNVVGAAMNGVSIYDSKKQGKNALVIGSESHGISDAVQELCDELVTIPNLEKTQKIESLNAAVATSVLLSELTR